jgi:hypothetical protein
MSDLWSSTVELTGYFIAKLTSADLTAIASTNPFINLAYLGIGWKDSVSILDQYYIVNDGVVN